MQQEGGKTRRPDKGIFGGAAGLAVHFVPERESRVFSGCKSWLDASCRDPNQLLFRTFRLLAFLSKIQERATSEFDVTETRRARSAHPKNFASLCGLRAFAPCRNPNQLLFWTFRLLVFLSKIQERATSEFDVTATRSARSAPKKLCESLRPLRLCGGCSQSLSYERGGVSWRAGPGCVRGWRGAG